MGKKEDKITLFFKNIFVHLKATKIQLKKKLEIWNSVK